METAFSPIDLVIAPPEEAWVERLPDGDLIIRWNFPAEQVKVYVGASPDMISGDQAFIAVSASELVVRRLTRDGSLTSLVTSPARPYFLLDLDGRRLVVAERTLPLAGGVNFRDLGGYRAADGRRTRWGRVYRAGSLAELTDDDVAYLGELGLRLSCDLRSAEETEAHSDRLPPGTTAMHRPIAAEVGRLRRLLTLFRKRHRIQELLGDVYAVMIDQNGPVFADFIRAADDPANLPLVVHCTAGKDRTGLAVALLLATLGVPDETIIADYTLSNHAFDVLAERMQPEMARLYAFGFDEAQLRPFLLAEARTMAGALAYLRGRYGSVESYLGRVGIDEEMVERLRGNLLNNE